MELLQDAAANLVALAAVATSVGVLSRLRPVRWLWRQLVARPLGTWFRGEVTEVVDERLSGIWAELRPNHGTSFRDHLDQRFDTLDQRQDEQGDRLATVEARTEGCPGAQGRA